MSKYLFGFLGILMLFTSCQNTQSDLSNEEGVSESRAQKSITLYTHRHYDTDKEIFAQFEEQTGITINVVKDGASALINKMETEGEQSPADLLITVDAGRLVDAKQKGLLQPIESDFLRKTVPEKLSDSQTHWIGLTKRARIVVYHPEKVDPEELTTYEDLVSERWKGKLLIRSSDNIYNQSLMASIIANLGEEAAEEWARGMVANFARTPSGNDRDQVKAILAGEGDIAIINTYYLGKLLNSADPQEVEAGEAVRVFFPNQGEGDRGAHINISGVGLAKHAKNKEDAIRLIEYLASKEVQERFASANYEYPVNPEAEASDLLKSWGDFKEDSLPLVKLGELNRDAVVLFDKVDWK
ncbi:MAG: Fe(3+) ABC transporter substrate-binding protein [Bacteroidota bacterium]